MVAKPLKPAAEMMRADAGLHAHQTRRRHIGKPRFRLAARPFLPQHDGTVLIESNDVERILADIDADEGDRILKSFCHGVLLSLVPPHRIACCWGGSTTGPVPGLTTSRLRFSELLHLVLESSACDTSGLRAY